MQVCVICHSFLFSPKFTNAYKQDNNQAGSMQNQQPQPSEGASSGSFGDSSGPLFSIYSKAAEEEDNKMVERWQRDADGILIFVSPRIDIRLSLHMSWNTVDRSIFCISRSIACCDSPGLEAKQSGYLLILPWEHLSGSRQPERDTRIPSIPCP